VAPGTLRDGLRCEDLMALTFDDESFDLVVTSDIFEHVRRPYEGFAEVRRVLKSGGVHVFSVPVLDPMPAKSVDRVDTSGDEDVFLESPTYHGPTNREHLVYTDFGQDMIDRLNAEGFPTRAIRYDRGSSATGRLLTFISVKE
jgi:SAM-dependent methyltransferase